MVGELYGTLRWFVAAVASLERGIRAIPAVLDEAGCVERLKAPQNGTAAFRIDGHVG